MEDLQAVGINYNLAIDPTTPPSQLDLLAPAFPLEVASNPNAEIHTLLALVSSWMAAFNHFGLEGTSKTAKFALFWAIQSNPSYDLLCLENLNFYRLIEEEAQDAAVRYLCFSLSGKELVLVACEYLRSYLDVINAMLPESGQSFLSTLYHTYASEMSLFTPLQVAHESLLREATESGQSFGWELGQIVSADNKLLFDFFMFLRGVRNGNTSTSTTKHLLTLLQEKSLGQSWADPTT